MDVTLANRGLLRVALVVFGLFLTYRFLATVASTALLVATGLLLAVALSGPVEVLHRRKLPRPAATAIVIVVLLVLLGLGSYLLLPTLASELSQLAFALPASLTQLWQQLQGLASRLGLQLGGGGSGISASTLTSMAHRVLGGALGLFGTLTLSFSRCS